MERCIKKSGINRGTISFAWKELGGADYAAVQAETAKEITRRIREWIEGHGDFPSIEEMFKGPWCLYECRQQSLGGGGRKQEKRQRHPFRT